jgi:hypothetical protein
MKKHRINNIMKLHKNLSYAMCEANLMFSVCCPKCDTSCVGLVRCWRWNLDLLKWAEF